MCEPHHSVVQFQIREANEYDDITPYSQMDPEQLLQAALRGELQSGYLQWGTRIGKYLHFSKLGSGHTGALRVENKSGLVKLNPTLPPATHYENKWWDKIGDGGVTKFDFDGSFQGHHTDRYIALTAAQKYSYSMSTCNIEKFTNFIRESVKNSSMAYSYVDKMVDCMLSTTGKEAVLGRLKLMNLREAFGYSKEVKEKEKAIDVVMNVLKEDRKLWKPEWADDKAFWFIAA